MTDVMALNHPYIFGVSWHVILLIYSLIQFPNILLKSSESIFIYEISL